MAGSTARATKYTKQRGIRNEVWGLRAQVHLGRGCERTTFLVDAGLLDAQELQPITHRGARLCKAGPLAQDSAHRGPESRDCCARHERRVLPPF